MVSVPMEKVIRKSIVTLVAVFTAGALSAGAASAADRPSAARGAPWSAAEITALHRDVDAILARRTLRGAHLGLIVVESSTGKILYAKNADDEFMPASNFKLLVGSAALRALGLGFTFKTTVSTDGTNLYLKGRGDAALRAADLAEAAANIAVAGISHVGAVVTDASYFEDQPYPEGWSWDDLPYYYAPVVSALDLEENVIHVYVRPGSAAGEPARLLIEPQTDAVTIDNRITTGAPGSDDTTDVVRTFGDWKTVTLVGSHPLDGKQSDDLEPGVPDPAAYAGDVFLRALHEHGVVVDGPVRPGVQPAGAQEVWSHASAPMPKLLADFWQPSDNLMGELFLRTLGVARSGAPGTSAHGIAAEEDYLKSIGVDPSTVSITDGSGLSQYDRITPRDLLMILQSDWRSEHRDLILDALPQSGVRGTLKAAYIGTPAEKNVFAKTGSISHVRTISGYLRTHRHGTVTFSFLLDDWLEDAAGLARLRADLFSRIITD